MVQALEAIRPREALKFPPSGNAELRHLREIVATKEATITPVGNLGYLVQNRKAPYVAEAPLILLDWDDTGAQTAQDKKRCFQELEGLGISKEIIKFCDKFSRVDMGERGDHELMYEPELEMRLFSAALLDRKDGKVDLTDDVRRHLEAVKEKMIETESTDEIPLDPEIRDIYQQTRYTSTLFPDTSDAIEKLKQIPGVPVNVALLTYGDPAFQLEKSMPLLDGDKVSQIFLTIAPKGKFFQEVLRQNPYRNISLTYRFADTPRDIGVDFTNWQVPVILFDDDPKQVASFNSIAEREGLTGLAVVRVRRPGGKYAEKEADLSHFTPEQISSSYLDVENLVDAMGEVTDRMFEHYLIQAVVHGGPDALSVPDVAQVVAALAEDRNTDSSIVRGKALAAAKNTSGSEEK
ncbi:MAG TPA: hypothetical protein VLB73_00755 [Patescibacteria group bacterium]|nr:hypothetical protein [Patescibacteria group bacterium]